MFVEQLRRRGGVASVWAAPWRRRLGVGGAAAGPPLGPCRRRSPADSTRAEQAVLAVVAAEHQKHGACTLPIGNVAALAGVSETTVRNAMREARRLGFLQVEERRVSAWRNLPNRLTITSREWLSWLKMRRRGVGANPCPPRVPEYNKGTSARRNGAYSQPVSPSKRWRVPHDQRKHGENNNPRLGRPQPAETKPSSANARSRNRDRPAT